MPSVVATDISAAMRAIDDEGYVVLENAVSSETASELAELVLQVPDRTEGVKGFVSSLSLLNHDRKFLELILHPFSGYR